MQQAMGQTDAPRRRASDATSASRRRFFFFCLASLWGYLLGIGVLAAALSRAGGPLSLDGAVSAWLLGGSLLGIAGGLVVAGAYREARRRQH